jgi:energy-coupling factor transport system ATP-binding protein
MIDLRGQHAGTNRASVAAAGNPDGTLLAPGPQLTETSADDEVVVDVQGVTFTHAGEEQPVLRDLTLQVRRGEFVLLIGPSGSGKSTATLLLNGIIPHTVVGNLEGSVRVFGMDTHTTPVTQFATHVGMVFQDPDAQIVNVNVRDEVFFGLENLRFEPDEIRLRAHEALALVKMLDKEHAHVFDLSGGQKQKVSLAAALAMRPGLLVLDEPTANLDPQGMRDVFETIYRLNRELGITVIMVENRVDELADKVSRVCVLNKGTIVSDGTPRDVFHAGHRSGLREAGMWLPQMSELALELETRVGPLPSFPLTVDEGAALVRELSSVRDRLQWPPVPDPQAPVSRPDAQPTAQPLLDIRDLVFGYPSGPPVLKHVNLSLEQGGIVAIVGQNGSGKTTLAKNIMGILTPPRGSVFLRGRDARALSLFELTQTVGYVFQNPDHQFVADRVFDEVAYSLRVRGIAEDIVQTKVRDILQQVDLDGRDEESPFGLSVGERRRLSVACMLILDQDLLILDEPTIGQDQSRADDLLRMLHEVSEQTRKTMIFITHDMRLVADWTRRTIVMTDGEVQYDGPTNQVFNDEALLRRAFLVEPPICALARRLRQDGTRDIPDTVVSIRQLVDYLV